MMEVKQNTAVDLNDLLTSPKNSGTDEVDDAVMSDLTDRTHDLVNCDLIKTNDKTSDLTELGNGDVAMASLINDVDDVEADLNATVNSELEDALLAEDDVLPKITNSKVGETTPTTADDILADKVETSNSTTSSNNLRDPGDDLDTLLSKINDIVEDCIDNESESTVNSSTLKSEQVIKKIAEPHEENNLNESVIFVGESKVADESVILEKDKSEDIPEISANEENNIEDHSEVTENAENKEIMSTEATTVPQELENLEEDAMVESNEPDKEENKDSTAKTELIEDKLSTPADSADKILENNQNQDKTEDSNAEVVQDNEITSNSNEISEIVKKPTTANEDNNSDKISSVEPVKAAEKNDASQTIDNAVETKDIPPAQAENVNNPTAASKTSDNVENDESDDEIVFYVDKPPEIEKSKETETRLEEAEKVETSTTENSASENKPPTPTKKTVEEDDDVVLLLDDEDEDVVENKKGQQTQDTEIANKKQDEQKVASEESTKTLEPSLAAEAKDIDIDNSDNACDDFVGGNLKEIDKSVEKTPQAETPEETNSNCSSSSNLLQEANSLKNSSDEPTPEDPENEEEEDEGDVELIESELKEPETSEKVEDSETAPPAKRIRLSEDSERSSKTEESCNETKDVASLPAAEKKQESQEILQEETTSEATSSNLKRTHDVIEVEAEEKSNDSKVTSEALNKKPRTDDLKTLDVESPEKSETLKDDKLSIDIKLSEDDKKDIKAVPSHQPIPLYPPPKLQALKSEQTISLEFLKKFRKSFDNMTKQDLEELVLQKVVEAIIHRSEFSEMRELIEKQEKLITAHRTKISELSKQFRDLEMVHNRVVKDIEQRNSQFIMPVKITRAVGLQVYIPNKKSLTETTSSSTGPSVPSSPQRPVASQAPASTSLTPPQRQFIASQIEQQPQQQQQRPGPSTSAGPTNTANVRRGCVQKITPIRPVPGASPSSSSSSGPTPVSAAYRATPNHSAVTQPRILNKNAITTTVNPTSIQRSRFLTTNQDGQRMPTQQQISRTPNMPANSQRVAVSAVAQPKPQSNVAATVQRRSEPLAPVATASSSSSIVDNYINTLTHLTGGNTAVSITPAKPKEKAVIDLTDEDETPGQVSSVQPATQVPVTQVQRRSLPGQNTSNTQLQYGRAAPTMARIPPANQMANNKNRQMSSLQAQKSNSFTSISTPPGTSITRINVPANSANIQRVKYSHPAPLPATPPQAFNPAWKLPPPRPTIRISNLDNGIVISWTMEESMDRHAECVSYQIYAYQETSGPPMVDSWRHVGDVKAMLLPMAVTLTQFQEGQRYYFAVRAVDCHQRFGPFSLPKTWS
ncbi:activating transcription factor 7-interacting protein 1 [Lucilia sericata]|uniref:activating transcription factor 7-interacting protein 1 n=1 Tax=Lucilia sericata TaxID=13632 RepID=UPI0018A86317|nr:activating transcription factor 7-interacting protein 1 [Lucilia sericata]XP_037810823.1 activating transcription factor 7-interacting protein 1 [Lucilia sericata]XP_037810824.1 activating transcription factor 7-interacting protein 1 [Lucilia sericata]